MIGDAAGGFSDSTAIYQGTASTFRPQLTQTHPTSLVAGGGPVTFTTTAKNTSPNPLGNIQFDLYLSGDDTATAGITAAQVHVQFSDADTNGFVDFPLDGTTVHDGVIQGSLLPDPAGTLKPGETHAITFKISLDATVPSTSTTNLPFKIETDIDQINPATGSVDNLEFAGPDNVSVNPILMTPNTGTTPVPWALGWALVRGGVERPGHPIRQSRPPAAPGRWRRVSLTECGVKPSAICGRVAAARRQLWSSLRSLLGAALVPG